MTAQEGLTQVRELLADPSRWIKGGEAKARLFDNPAIESYVSATHPKAHRWCLVGALKRVAAPDNRPLISAMREELHKYEPGSLIIFNDQAVTSHEDVLNLLDRAIRGTG